MTELQLLITNANDDEVFTKFYLNMNSIQGFFFDPDDTDLVSLVIHGENYVVKTTDALLEYLTKVIE